MATRRISRGIARDGDVVEPCADRAHEEQRARDDHACTAFGRRRHRGGRCRRRPAPGGPGPAPRSRSPGASAGSARGKSTAVATTRVASGSSGASRPSTSLSRMQAVDQRHGREPDGRAASARARPPRRGCARHRARQARRSAGCAVRAVPAMRARASAAVMASRPPPTPCASSTSSSRTATSGVGRLVRAAQRQTSPDRRLRHGGRQVAASCRRRPRSASIVTSVRGPDQPRAPCGAHVGDHARPVPRP